jgi:excisionase family DNA binding protein
MSYEADKPGTAAKRLTLTVREVAAVLGVSPTTVVELARVQLLPNYKVGNTYWFPVRRLAELYPHFFEGDVAA